MRTYRLLFLCLAVLSLVLLVGCGVQVPDLKGKTERQAEQALTQAGFKLGKVSYDGQAQSATGAVVSQDPRSGRRGSSGAIVNVVIAGRPPVTVPDLTGLQKKEAVAAIAAAGLSVGNVTEAYTTSATAGVITSQTPVAGGVVPRSSGVSIIISKGRQPVAVPSVKGKAAEEAKKMLAAAGFRVQTLETTDESKKGTVLKQEPVAGTSIAPGGSVKLTVSSGVEMVKVPRVVGSFFSDAERRLRRSGFAVRSISVYAGDGGGSTDGSVYKQSPSGGSMRPRGSRVTIWWGYESS